MPAKKKQESNHSRPQIATKPCPIKFTGLNSPSASFSEQLANDKANRQHLRRLNQNRGLYFVPNAAESEAKDIVGLESGCRNFYLSDRLKERRKSKQSSL